MERNTITQVVARSDIFLTLYSLHGNSTISIGTLNASLMHPREVFKDAIIHNAYSVVLAHNHPSDDPEPSEDDLTMTERLIETGKILGIEVLDHIIISKKGFFSFKEKGLI